MTCHSIIRCSFSKEFAYNDKKDLTLQKGAERKSKTPVPIPVLGSHLHFIMTTVNCSPELLYKINPLDLGFLRPGSVT